MRERDSMSDREAFRRLRRHAHRMFVALACCVCLAGAVVQAQGHATGAALQQIRYDETTRTFRMDSAGVSYMFGVNQNGELQTLYWGKRLQAGDPIPPALADGGTSAFD